MRLLAPGSLDFLGADTLLTIRLSRARGLVKGDRAGDRRVEAFGRSRHRESPESGARSGAPGAQAVALVADDEPVRAGQSATGELRAGARGRRAGNPPRRAASANSAAAATARGRRKIAPMAARTTLGWYGSTPSWPKTTPRAPKASAERSSVPTLPGSLRSARTRLRPRHRRGIERAGRAGATATRPGGVSRSEILRRVRSSTMKTGTPSLSRLADCRAAGVGGLGHVDFLDRIPLRASLIEQRRALESEAPLLAGVL